MTWALSREDEGRGSALVLSAALQGATAGSVSPSGAAALAPAHSCRWYPPGVGSTEPLYAPSSALTTLPTPLLPPPLPLLPPPPLPSPLLLLPPLLASLVLLALPVAAAAAGGNGAADDEGAVSGWAAAMLAEGAAAAALVVAVTPTSLALAACALAREGFSHSPIPWSSILM